MGASEFIELPEWLSIEYLTSIFPLTLSLSPKGRGEGKGDISWLPRKKRCFCSKDRIELKILLSYN